jgi:hypothetical protein
MKARLELLLTIKYLGDIYNEVVRLPSARFEIQRDLVPTNIPSTSAIKTNESSLKEEEQILQAFH